MQLQLPSFPLISLLSLLPGFTCKVEQVSAAQVLILPPLGLPKPSADPIPDMIPTVICHDRTISSLLP